MIREATEDDISQILEIERDAISPPWTHGALLREIYSDDTFFAVVPVLTSNSPLGKGGCEADGVVPPQGRGLSSVLGFIILRRAADEGELYQIAVDAEHRRQGIADELMDAAIDWANANGINPIYLEVRKSNEAAISLYDKHDFIQAGIRKEYFTEPTEDAVIMENKK